MGADNIVLRHGALSFSALSQGTGPVVLCLHGFPDNVNSFRHQLPVLADAGYRAVAVTLRGYEASSQSPDNSYAVDAMATDVIACLDDLGVEKAHLIGHDWGAAIAYVAGAMAPMRFHSLSTMTVPHVGRFTTEMLKHPKQLLLSWYMTFFQIRGVSDYFVERNNYAFIRMLWRRWSPGWQFEEADIASVIKSFQQPGVKQAALAYYRAIMSLQNLGLVPGARKAAAFEVNVPTLALTGALDRCIDSGVFQAMMHPQDFPAGLIVHEIENAGHFLHQERPDEINDLLLNWLQQHTRENN